MRRLISAIVLALLFTSSLSFSWTRWQTTKIAQSTGKCQLSSNTIRVNVHSYYLDVEEEAVITASGTVNWGDPNTLEITGEFQLSPGATMRSMLLWNGDKLLKAKLIDRDKADSIMDTIVNKTYHDPALIKYLGKNRYLFRIYPVAINNSRKIRVLYSIPLQSNSRLQLEFQPAFTLGAEGVPTQIPVEIISSDSSVARYMIQHGNTKKSIQLGATYMIPFQDFYRGNKYNFYNPNPAPIIIIPDTSIITKAFSFRIESTKAAGNYTAILSTVPDSLKKIITEAVLPDYSLEVKIKTTEKTYLIDVAKDCLFNVYMKSQTPWDGTIYWNVYDKNGTLTIQHPQTIPLSSDSSKNALLPLLWGAKYTLVEGLGNTGAIFGFVDNKMSLLALEKDTLSANEAALWLEKGVPLLLPEDIIADTGKIALPKENLIFDITNTIVFNNLLDRLGVLIKSGNRIVIQLAHQRLKKLNVSIYDTRGRLIVAYHNLKVTDRTVQCKLPATMKGMYVIQIQSGSLKVSRKLVLK